MAASGGLCFPQLPRRATSVLKVCFVVLAAMGLCAQVGSASDAYLHQTLCDERLLRWLDASSDGDAHVPFVQVESAMSLNTTARVAPEKRTVTIRLPMVFLWCMNGES